MRDFNHSVNQIVCFVCSLIFLFGYGACAETLPPDPTNAALLYYQAFLLRPEPDYATKELVYNTNIEKIWEFLHGGKIDFDPNIEDQIRGLEEKLNNYEADPNQALPSLNVRMRDVNYGDYLFSTLNRLRERHKHQEKMRDVDPNKVIRNYLRKCHGAIELAEVAFELTECDWGFHYSQGNILFTPLLIEIRELHTVLRTDAFLLAADGHYREAFERCLMMRRFARHVGDDALFFYTTSNAIGSNALRFIRIMLGYTKPDLATLKWLKDQLKAEESPPMSLVRMLKMEMELGNRRLQTNEKLLSSVRDELSEKIGTGDVSKKVDSLSDDEVIVYVKGISSTFLSDAIQVINRKASYSEKHAELKRLKDEIENEFEDCWNTYSVVMRWSSDPPALYKHHVLHIAHFNAHMAGMGILLDVESTRKLPERIPDALPKDPFTGNDFMYEITEDGFVLSLPSKGIPGMKLRPYEFKIKR